MALEELTRLKETDTMKAVKERLTRIVSELEKRGVGDAVLQVYEEKNTYALLMSEKYPELSKKVEAFHALIGSGIPLSVDTIPDFPEEEDSVMKFIDTLEKKLLRESE